MFFIIVIAALSSSTLVCASKEMPAIFVFGDSLADVGNNNNYSAPLRANYPHNGIDFPGRVPTGRFGNGYNTIDYIAKLVGYKQSPPAYLSVTDGKQMLQGVNFASGGSGILDTTGVTITFTAQLRNFVSAIGVVEKQIGQRKAKALISNSLILISAGSNDIAAYYQAFGAQNATKNQQFIASLLDKFTDRLKELYGHGARKFGILGLAHIGCIPLMRNINPLGICVEDLNSLSRDYNAAAKPRLHFLKLQLCNMKYSIANVYHMVTISLKRPELLGYTNVIDACCGSGKFNGGGPCVPNATVCSNRDQYLFWDRFHPTQAASMKLANMFYSGNRKFAAPDNLKSLIKCSMSNFNQFYCHRFPKML